MFCLVSISSSSPAHRALGSLAKPLAWLGLVALGLVTVLWWCAEAPEFRSHQAMQERILSPLLSGNLLLLTVTIAFDVWLAEHEPQRLWRRIGLWSGGLLAGTATSFGGVYALGLWGSDTAFAAVFLVPGTALVVAPFLAGSAALLGSNRSRCALLASFLLVAAAVIHLGVRAAARHPRGNLEAVLMACSVVMGLAIFIWLAVWSARPVRRSA